MKETKRISISLLILLALLAVGCTNPSKVAVEFVTQHPELRDSVKEHVLKNRVPDVVLERWSNISFRTSDLEHAIVDHSLEKLWDEFNSTGLIQYPDRPAAYHYAGFNVNIHPVIGYSHSSSMVALRVNYHASNWLFLKQIILLVGDKRYATPMITVFDTSVARDVNYDGTITERKDFYLTSKATEELVYAVVNAPESVDVKVRLLGDTGYLDFVLPIHVRRAWQDVIWYYDKEYKSK